jgi:hypothetical protein
MKSIALVSLVLFTTPAFAKSVELSCLCSYQADYLFQPPIPVTGRDSNATGDSTRSCQITDPKGRAVNEGQWGRVADADVCGFAILNAQYNCEQQVRAKTGTDVLKPVNAYADPTSCWGRIGAE